MYSKHEGRNARYSPTLLETGERCNEPYNKKQQEPKITADLSNDEHFIQQCASGKDAYGILASLAFNRSYEDCLEFYLDENGNKTHETNKEGKEVRSRAKKILLGICYGKSMESIAEDLNVTKEKAQEIYDCVLTNIPGLKSFMEESQEMARQLGYVTDKWGRRRYIPDMQLQPYEITSVGSKNFDPFFDSEVLGVIDDTEKLKRKYLEELKNVKYNKQKDKIKQNAENDGFKIKENTRKIEDATRQCVNCVDKETQILTKDGWKFYNELILFKDEIITYNTDTQKLEWEPLTQLNVYEQDIETLNFTHPTFSAVTTYNHRWPVYHKKHNKIEWMTSEDLQKSGNNWCDWSLLKIADNDFSEASYEDWFLKIVGYYLTDGNKGQTSRNIRVSQSSTANLEKCKLIEQTFKDSGKRYSSYINKNGYVTWNMGYETGEKIRTMFPNKTLTADFITSLSQRQANILVEALMLGDGHKNKDASEQTFVTNDKQNADLFQMLCVIAGIATNITVSKKSYFTVKLLSCKTIDVYKEHISKDKTSLVWCPTTKNETWLARRNTEIYITGNSRVQGSAATQSKIAMRLIGTNPNLKKQHFSMELLVHDEIIGEVPFVYAKQAIPEFRQCMLTSGKDLRTGCAVDVECCLKWYGESIEPEDLTIETLKKLKKELYGV